MNPTEEIKLAIELAKLIASVATPVVILLLGVFVSRYIKRLDNRYSVVTALLQRRLDFYDAVAVDLNRLYCFLTYIGDWRAMDPAAMVDLKRALSRQFICALPYISHDTYKAWARLEDACFLSGRGRRTHALVRASVDMHREARKSVWREDWEKLFVEEGDRTPRVAVHAAYTALLECFSLELGGTVDKMFSQELAARLQISASDTRLGTTK